MELTSFVDRLRSGKAADFPADANSLEFARKLDSQDSISHLRDEFNIPTKTSLKKTSLNGSIPGKKHKITHAYMYAARPGEFPALTRMAG